MTDPAAVRHVVADAFAALGVIDVVVNNAGYGLFAAVEEASDEQIRHVLDTNLLGSITVIRAALPHLRARGYGRILQVSSAGGQTTYPNFGYYHASKWGIEGFCETVAQEIAPFGIGLTIVEPGATPTGFGSGLDNDPARIVEAMIASADSGAAPLRLPLGRDTYEHVRASLVKRLESHDAHREAALSVALPTAEADG